ncbi:MAG: DCC1-like thiol-disulfide oxidoreductase family protein, partial [Parvularculaceae bacterium]
VAYGKWRGWLETAKAMPAPWRWLGFLGAIIPPPLDDAIYDIIQRNRFGWFGKRAECLVPDEALAARFL